MHIYFTKKEIKQLLTILNNCYVINGNKDAKAIYDNLKIQKGD